MKINFLTLFPEMFPGCLGQAISGKALEKGLWDYEVFDIREGTTDKHRTVDDTPYGGGAGMLMKADVLEKSIEKCLKTNPKTRFIYPSPRGKVLNQRLVDELATEENITILCGRYEGVDQRILDFYGFEELSVGDFILSGGEIASFVIIDACIRKINGVLGNAETHEEESFSIGDLSKGGEFLLEYPHYTRPEVWKDLAVPEVLKSGNHKEIAKWRLNMAERLTELRRPEIYTKYLELKNSKK